jgi:plastocyanin
MRKVLIILVVLMSVFLGIGCTGTQTNQTEAPVEVITPSETPAITPVGTPVTLDSNTTPLPAGENKIVEVSMQNFAFNPQSVEISTGDTVKWTNMDSATHDVKGTGFASNSLAKGDTYEFQFTEAGTYDYICTFHPSMKGTVVVKGK